MEGAEEERRRGGECFLLDRLNFIWDWNSKSLSSISTLIFLNSYPIFSMSKKMLAPMATPTSTILQSSVMICKNLVVDPG